ncbi:MAG: hypothetical protein H7173_12965 [Rhodoferax sp.]|nr:hypothetical protein [Pseudorhodobacter sp.]
MLQAVTLHPAMLVYLDHVLSLGPHRVRGESKQRVERKPCPRNFKNLAWMRVILKPMCARWRNC